MEMLYLQEGFINSKHAE